MTVLTTWSKDGYDINDNSRSRIAADGIAIQNSSVIHVYESALVFSPLSNMDTGGDSGGYKCSVKINDDQFISGITANAIQTLAVQGQSLYVPFLWSYNLFFLLLSRPEASNSECEAFWQLNCWGDVLSPVFRGDSRGSEV